MASARAHSRQGGAGGWKAGCPLRRVFNQPVLQSRSAQNTVVQNSSICIHTCTNTHTCLALRCKCHNWCRLLDMLRHSHSSQLPMVTAHTKPSYCVNVTYIIYDLQCAQQLCHPTAPGVSGWRECCLTCCCQIIY